MITTNYCGKKYSARTMSEVIAKIMKDIHSKCKKN